MIIPGKGYLTRIMHAFSRPTAPVAASEPLGGATYTIPAVGRQVRVRMVGGGGGGAVAPAKKRATSPKKKSKAARRRKD